MRRWRFFEWALVVGVVLHAIWPLLWGEHTLLPYHDNLDGNHPLFYRLAHGPEAFAGPRAPFEPMMNGSVQRGTLQSDLSLLFWVYRLAPNHIAAYQWHHLITVLVAFGSMLLLLHALLWRPEGAPWHIPLAAVYAWVPFFPAFSLGVAALPLAFWALSRLAKQSSGPVAPIAMAAPIAALVGYALSAPLYYTTVFAVAAGGVAFAVLSIRQRRPHWPLALGVITLAAVSLACEWRLLVLVLEGEMARSHRVEFDRGYLYLNIKGIIDASQRIALAFDSNVHYDRLWVGAVGVAAMLVSASLTWRGPVLSRPAARLALGAGAAAAACAASGYILVWGALREVLEAYYSIGLTRTFDLKRIFTFVPMLWTVALAAAGAATTAALSQAAQAQPSTVFGRWAPRVAPLLPLLLVLALQLQHARVHTPYVRYYTALLAQPEAPLTERADLHRQAATQGLMSMQQFYAPALWREVASALWRDSLRLGSVGLHPCIALLYDLRTIDGYANVYPLAYKRTFRPAIAGELAKDSLLADYYDRWGSRVMLFSAELRARSPIRYAPFDSVAVPHLALDPVALRALGLGHLVSSSRIANAEQLQLDLVSVHRSPDLLTTLFLYRLRR